jgi:hypothetical protein
MVGIKTILSIIVSNLPSANNFCESTTWELCENVTPEEAAKKKILLLGVPMVSSLFNVLWMLKLTQML